MWILYRSYVFLVLGQRYCPSLLVSLHLVLLCSHCKLVFISYWGDLFIVSSLSSAVLLCTVLSEALLLSLNLVPANAAGVQTCIGSADGLLHWLGDESEHCRWLADFCNLIKLSFVLSSEQIWHLKMTFVSVIILKDKRLCCAVLLMLVISYLQAAERKRLAHKIHDRICSSDCWKIFLLFWEREREVFFSHAGRLFRV